MHLALDVRMAQTPRVGVGVYVRNLVTSLWQYYPEVETTLIAAAGQPFELTLPTQNARILYSAPSYRDYIQRDCWEQFRLPGVLDDIGADVYHSPNYILPVKRRMQTKRIVTIHDASLFTLPSYYGWLSGTRVRNLTRMALRAADAVLVDSCFTEDELRRLFHLVVPVKVAYMGVPTEFLDAIATYATSHAEPPRRVEARDGTPIDLNRPYVVSVGTINRRKNYAKLCEAFSRAPLKDVSLLLIGELGNSARQLFRQVQRSGAGGRISLLGRLSNADLVKLMSGARALAAPSLYEGFGLPILESFALGIPVCAARASCFPEVAGDAAAYFDGNSADSIAECIAAVVDDLPRAGVLADLGRLRVRDFSWQAFAASHVDLYTSVLASRS